MEKPQGKNPQPACHRGNGNGELFRCDKGGAMFESKKTHARHMQCHGGKKIDRAKKTGGSRSSKKGGTYATASLEVRGWPVQGGAPGLGKKS